MPTSDSRDYELIDRLAEEFAERIRNGERPSLQEYCDKYPHIAADLREMLPALAEVEQLRVQEPAAPPAAPALRAIGDYQILREVGRGGMGVVYEAEDTRLGRRVALKVLAGGKSGSGLERFKREAKAAARLHHTNIVPVFGVGDHEGLPYYVMQFIQGLGLDEVLEEVKRLQAASGAAVPPSAVSAKAHRKDISAAAVARSLVTGTFDPPAAQETLTYAPAVVGQVSNLSDQSGQVGNLSHASSSSISLPGQSNPAGRKPTYWQSIAQIGLQVADALAYAHQQGVLHRDIKPSNLLLDLHGVVWVTDFGLAKAADQEDLTHTGDVLGTLRYMPPEAFEGTSDARSDVYALGLSLYELLALRPAYDERKREAIIKQVTTTEPPRLGSLNRSIPRDLATIVHKAIEKGPGHRYQSAAELAADLRRYLSDQPIRARRISPVERFGRWCKRNPAVAASLTAVGVALIAGAAVSAVFALEAGRRAEAEAEANRKAQEALVAADAARADAVEQAGIAKQKADEATAAEKKAVQLTGHLALSLADTEVLLQSSLARSSQTEWTAGNAGQARRLVHSVRWGVDRPADVPTLRQRPTELGLLQCLYQGGYATLYGHAGSVFGVAFTPDGRELLTGGEDGFVRVWDAVTGRQLRSWKASTNGVACLAISPDGRWLATSDGAVASPSRLAEVFVRLWDLATGAERLVVSRGYYWCGLAFGPDGRTLFTLDHEMSPVRTLYPSDRPLSGAVWEVPSGVKLADLPNSVGRSSAFARRPQAAWPPAVGPGGRTVVYANRDLHDWAGGQTWAHPTTDGGGAGRRAGRVVVSPSGGWVAYPVFDEGVRLLGIDSDAPWGVPGLGSEAVTALAAGPDGETLAVGTNGGTIHIWHVAAGRAREQFVLRGHQQPIAGLAFGPDGQRLASCAYTDRPDEPGEARLWDLRFGEDGLVLRDPSDRESGPVGRGSSALAFGENAVLYTATPDGRVRTWDVETGAVRGRFREPTPTLLVSLAAHPGRPLVIATDGGLRFTGPTPRDLAVRALNTPQGRARSPAYSPDGRTVAVLGWQGNQNLLHLLDAETGAFRAEAKHTTASTALAWGHDGTTLVTGSFDYGLTVWDADPLRPRTELHGFHNNPLGHQVNVQAVACHPTADRIASADQAGTLLLWDPAESRPLCTFRGHTDWINAVAFSPDGRLLASGGDDGRLLIWEAEPHEVVVARRRWRAEDRGNDLPIALPLVSLPAAGRVTALAFSPDGRRLAVTAGGVTVVREVVSTREPFHVPVDRPTTIDLAQGVIYREEPDGRVKAFAPDRLDPRPPGWRAAKAAFDPAWHVEQARLCDAGGRWFAARFHLDQLERHGLREPGLDWAFVLAQALRKDPKDLRAQVALVRHFLSVKQNDPVPAANPLVTDFLRRLTQELTYTIRRDPDTVALLAETRALIPLGSAVEPVRNAIAPSDMEFPPRSDMQRLNGSLLFREGKHEEALKKMTAALANRGLDGPPLEELWLALIHKALGHADEARQFRTKALEWMGPGAYPVGLLGGGAVPALPMAERFRLLPFAVREELLILARQASE